MMPKPSATGWVVFLALVFVLVFGASSVLAPADDDQINEAAADSRGHTTATAAEVDELVGEVEVVGSRRHVGGYERVQLSWCLRIWSSPQ